ncbi:MAG: 2-C-methyl-D-erythritol 4-phosphate cytidylyltransferase [Bacteroidales bacterium]|nr:2-C-methyl-D-erythritol 4-phosphate cytidylyltransferase [Bacteroidales bacterium]
MKTFVIIVAGGKGMRMKKAIPKQFLLLNSQPILMHTLKQFYTFDKNIKIILVLPQHQIIYWKELCEDYNFNIPHIVTKGGNTRFQSVKNGLNNIKEKGLVAIHDGVRPLVSFETLNNCFVEAEKSGNAIPVVEIEESIRLLENNKNKTVSRLNYRIVQTPQIFSTELIKEAYKCEYSSDFTDDSSVLEKTGVKINLVPGNKENIKITTKQDLEIAEILLTKLQEN